MSSLDPPAADWRRRRQPESSGAAEKRAAERAEVIGRYGRRKFYGEPP